VPCHPARHQAYGADLRVNEFWRDAESFKRRRGSPECISNLVIRLCSPQLAQQFLSALKRKQNNICHRACLQSLAVMGGDLRDRSVESADRLHNALSLIALLGLSPKNQF
jgi:hypothetical protein